MKVDKICRGILLLVLVLELLTGCNYIKKDTAGDNEVSTNVKDVMESNPVDGEDALKSKEDNIVLAGIYKAGFQAWFIDEGAAAEVTAKELGADEFIFIDSDMDPVKYMQAIDNIIELKVDGVLTCIADQKLSKEVAEKLLAAHIPVIAVDDTMVSNNNSLLVPYIGIDAFEIGKSNGIWMAKYAQNQKLETGADTAVLMMTMNSVSSCLPRTDGQLSGFRETLPNFPFSHIYYADYNGEMDNAYTVANSLLVKENKYKKWLVMSANEEGAIGAVRALEQCGLDQDSCAIGMGGNLSIEEFQKSYSALKAASYFSPEMVGTLSANAMMAYILKGTPIPNKTLISATIITRENYKEIVK